MTGHAMDAAIPVVMFSGLLKSHMELEGTLQERFERLNRSLYGTLPGRAYICFTMGELDVSTRTLRVCNGGCPYPYHYRDSAGELAELSVSAGPFGLRSDMMCQVVDIAFESGDLGRERGNADGLRTPQKEPPHQREAAQARERILVRRKRV